MLGQATLSNQYHDDLTHSATHNTDSKLKRDSNAKHAFALLKQFSEVLFRWLSCQE